ncbi:LamG-like jellyroll fold domain-containing protein [Rubritalea squalenifaciens]|nr:LamG-like jellyroll fold domain-containing protein [Rubritalea squalenifaciens]
MKQKPLRWSELTHRLLVHSGSDTKDASGKCAGPSPQHESCLLEKNQADRRPVYNSRSWSIALACSFGLLAHTGLLATPAYDWDFQTHYAHANAQPASLTSTQLSAIQQVDASYPGGFTYYNGTGLSQAQMDAVDAIRSKFALVRDSGTGVVTGRGIVMDGEGSGSQTNLSLPASFNGDFLPSVRALADYYKNASAAQAPTLEQLYYDLVEHFLDQNYLPGGQSVPGIGNGYTWRNNAPQVYRMAHSLPAAERDLLGLSMFYVSYGRSLLNDHASASTDIYLNYFPTAFKGLALIGDNEAKWQLLGLVRRGLDVSITGKEGNHKAQLVPLDGAVIHHDGHHISYAQYSFGSMVSYHKVMTQAGFTSDFTAEAVERFRSAALAWDFSTTGDYNPLHMQMRAGLRSGSSPTSSGFGRTVYFPTEVARLSAAFKGQTITEETELAYAAISKAGAGSTSLPVEWQSMSIPSNISSDSPLYTAALKGHYSHTTNGVSVHRGDGGDDWLVTLRGQHGHWRGGEAYDAMGLPDHFNVKSMHGALMVMPVGNNGRKPNEVDSGFQYEGWDYSYYPNVTTKDIPYADFLYWRTPAYFGGESNLMGSANLRKGGIWMYHAGHADKSAFFMGKRIVLVTNNITSSDTLHTGLIQQAHSDPGNQGIDLDGTVQTGTGSWSLPAGGGHEITDANGTGYYVHPLAGNPPVVAERGAQQWTYSLPAYYNGTGSAPSYTYASDWLNNMQQFDPTSGFFSKVWFDHGAAPQDQFVEYSVLVKPQPGELAAYATAMENPATAPVTINRSSKVHRFYDKASRTYAAAVFDATEQINEGELVSVSRPGAYIWRKEAGTLWLSCSSSETSDKSDFQIVLDGQWLLQAEEHTYQVSVAPYGGDTLVSLSYRQAAPQRIALRKVVPDTLVAHWDFNDASDPNRSCDVENNTLAAFEGGAAYSADAGGRTSSAGDRALDLGTSSSGQTARVAAVQFLKEAAQNDKLTISYWQKQSQTGYKNSSFWAVSPSSSAGQRGIQAHSPWSNDRIYFDCGGTSSSNRIWVNASSVLWTSWTHVAYVKDGGTASIYVNGSLLSSASGKSPLVTDFTELFIGSAQDGGNSLRGLLDDFAIYNTALDASQVSALAQGTAPDQIIVNQAPSASGATLSVPENTAGGVVLTTVSATDTDGGDALRYEILSGNAQGQFTIDYITGEISTTSLLDYESLANPVFSLSVQVTDLSGATDTAVIAITVTDIANDDSDADGLTDEWEVVHFGFVAVTTGAADSDGDGLSNEDEELYAMDPNNPDEDSDGLLDGEEILLGTDPYDPDTDDDTLPDGDEILFGTDPLVPDRELASPAVFFLDSFDDDATASTPVEGGISWTKTDILGAGDHGSVGVRPHNDGSGGMTVPTMSGSGKFLNGGRSTAFSYPVTDGMVEGYTYQLSVWGRRAGSSYPVARCYFGTAPTTPVAGSPGNIWPGSSWVEYTTSYTATAADAGQPLWLVLEGRRDASTGVTAWDDAKVTVTP